MSALPKRKAALSALSRIRGDFFTFRSFNSGVSGNFSYTAPSFITTLTTVPVASLNSCTHQSTEFPTAVCGDQEFLPDFNPGYNTVFFAYFLAGFGTGNTAYYFAENAFTTAGSYDSLIFGQDQFAQLTVTDLNAVAAVPEPATWAMMIAGFGIVGGAMRKTNRRRRSNVRVTYA